MALSLATQDELQNALRGYHYQLPPRYLEFLVKWIALNRAYSEMFSGPDADKVLALGDRYQRCWVNVTDLAREMVSLECIGGDRLSVAYVLAPNKWAKSATLHLRECLEVVSMTDLNDC